MSDIKRPFTVKGQPFFPLGGQARNSSGYNAAEAETSFLAVKALHGNMLEIPVYWEQVEPVEGQYDFASVEMLLAGARRHGLRLVLLWFATWKNGNMAYAPSWVKDAPERFTRVIAPTGRPQWVLSSHCRATYEADRNAFVALCQYLKEHDAVEQTVIAIQIENEPGILGSDRDYGPVAQAEFDGPVPAELVAHLEEEGDSAPHLLWMLQGSPTEGSWPEMFGGAAGEILSTWSIARYLDGIAEAGKAVHDIPMYVNVWLGENDWQFAGESYPSGGAVSEMLDLYRWAAPHIDLIAPDIYIPDSLGYETICDNYSRDDNPLFVPESAPGGSNAWLMFRAIADYDAVGYAFFAAETILDAQGAVRPEAQPIVDSFRCVAAAIPLLLKYQGPEGQVQAVVQEENTPPRRMDFSSYVGMIEFDGANVRGAVMGAPKDWHHAPHLTPASPGARGRGLVIQADDREFYLVGDGFRLFLRPRLMPQWQRDGSLTNRLLMSHNVQYLSVDEGHFDANGQFVVDRRRNGDEVDHGVWVAPDCGVVRVLLCE
jgi:hypothetical protein